MRRDTTLALLIFIVSVLLLFDRLSQERTIEIVMEGGRAVPIEGQGYFTFSDALFCVICAFLAGTSATYIFLKSDVKREEIRSGEKEDMSQTALKILQGDEARLYKMILDAGGEMLQKDLILEGGFDKVRVTRLLDRLEGKGLVLRIKHGMTNRIMLKKEG